MELGLSEIWTVELLPLPIRGAGEIVEPEAPGEETMAAVGSPDATTKPPAGDEAGTNSSIGDGMPLDACSVSKPMANEVKPLAPTTGVARTASEVRPLVPTTGVNTTAGEVRPLAAAMGVEKTAREVRPLAPTTCEGMTAMEV